MAVPTVSLEALTAAACEENRQAARKITACYEVHRSWITLDAEHKHYSRYGRTEMAVALGCSATVAESYVSIAVALHTRLPLLRAAFETGEVDLARVRTVCRILDNLSDDIVKKVEDEVVEAAHRLSPGPLEKEIWDILLRVAPEEAAALREFAKRFRTVTYTPAGELARIRAELTAPEAAAAWQLLEEMADTLCPKDPRGKKERLCDAFMARMHGEPRLACLCRREDCPKADAVLPDRRVPLTMVTVDIATLIGLLANPAYLAGHGSIDPDLARELARNSQWQVLLTEAITLAESLGLAVQNPETGEWERTPTEQEQESDPGSAATSDTDTDRSAPAGAVPGTAAGAVPDSDADASAGTDTTAETPTDANAGAGAGAQSASTADSSAETASASEPTGPSSPAPEHSSPAGDRVDQVDNPVPITEPATDPAATTTPGSGPAHKHAATTASAAITTPLPEPCKATGPEPVAAPAPAPTSSTPVQQRPTADPAPDTNENQSPTAPSDTTRNHETGSDEETISGSEPTPIGSPAPSTRPDAGTDTEDRPPRRLQSLTSAAALFCTHTPVGRGTRHSSALDLASAIRRNNRTIPTASHTPSGLYIGNASLAAALEAAIAADPTLGKSVSRDPLTDRALIYRPDTLTTAAVRLRDKHCRFPGCHRPAARCQLDHINPFDHTNPLGGGWTTVNNLQCLCEYHHTVKTAGYWKAVMLPGGAILWTSTSKTTRITLPANGTAVPILGNDLRPHIPTQPRNSGIIAYPNPPDNQRPETDDTAAPPF
ncbi:MULTISPECIES: HNH endonuclease [unclassified Rhodococcus (in: high G+C Gram-positive bacteria)]|uniref:HNH endonuclease n=1 Tax=unclassified Rhodococcus (in: high G+C Gram-positive bacteria) TaxID=192944 RepID=UPI00159612BC|nr:MULTISPECIES: HNH endonuclease signature motif containing protein [unclassified Rhodococcus (in: high G+C Gram-positive bacteria)]